MLIIRRGMLPRTPCTYSVARVDRHALFIVAMETVETFACTSQAVGLVSVIVAVAFGCLFCPCVAYLSCN